MGDVSRTKGPRLIGIFGPFASGKTTLLEAILERAGAIDKAGSVASGTSLGDASPEARAHAMSVELNAATCAFMGDSYTFLDCPGSVEFVGESAAVIPAIDAAIVVAEADEKKLPALQVVMRALEEANVPRFLFLNKIDKAQIGARDALALLQRASAIPLVLRQLPIWKDGVAAGFIDLALDRAHLYKPHSPSEVVDLSREDFGRRDEARFAMLETLADHDDALMESLLEDAAVSRETVLADLVAEVRAGQIVPVLIGSAENGNGILRLLKALRHETLGVAAVRARLGLGETNEPVAQVLKTIHTTHGGKLSLVRVLSGRVEEGMELTASNGAVARVAGVLSVTGPKTVKRGPAEAGETVALAKLEGVPTGATLAQRAGAARPLVTLSRPQPVLKRAIAPTERKDEVKLSAALARLLDEDPSLAVEHRQETGETLLCGQGEMHLRVAVERLTAKYGLSLDTRDAVVPYRETIRGSTTKRGRHKKQSGGHGQFGDVVLEIKPNPRGAGFSFDTAISGGVVPRQYFPAVEAGAREALQHGPLGGFPVVDVGVTLIDGSYHTVDSSEAAFKMAAILAMRDGLPECRPVLLEPILKVRVTIPTEATAKVNAIVSGRRGQLMGYDARPGWAGWDEVEALIPEAEIADLIIELRSATAGVGTFSAEFDHLAEVTGRLTDDVLARHAKEAA